jgi:hypothetical protein
MDGFYSGATLMLASAPAIRSLVPDGLSIKKGRAIAARPRVSFTTWINRRLTEDDVS